MSNLPPRSHGPYHGSERPFVGSIEPQPDDALKRGLLVEGAIDTAKRAMVEMTPEKCVGAIVLSRSVGRIYREHGLDLRNPEVLAAALVTSHAEEEIKRSGIFPGMDEAAVHGLIELAIIVAGTPEGELPD